MARGRNALWLALVVWLAACTGGANWPWVPVPTATAPALPSPTPTATATPRPASPTDLRVWVAASLGPEQRPAAWKLLARAGDEFALRRGLTVEMRVKPDWGPGGLGEALLWARVAAPHAAPDLVLAPVEVFEAARLKTPWPPLPEDLRATLLTAEGWYPFAREAVLEHGQPFAYPVAAEAPVLAWPTGETAGPTTWDAWLEAPVPWTWAAREPWAWSAWALYYAAGGQVGPVTQPALLQAEPLADMLEFLVQARWNGGMRSDALLWSDPRALAQANLADEVALVVWSSDALQDEARTWVPLPGPEGPGPLIMRVYAWVVLTDDPSRQILAEEWLRQVVAPGWNGPWARAAGLWPASPQALRRGWEPAQAEAWEPWLQTAQPAPPLAARAAASQALRAAVARVLSGTHTPLDAAHQALVDLGAAQPRPTSTPTP